MEVPAVTDTAPVPTFNPWLHPMAGGEAPPLSERLIRALEAHVAASAADIATCRELTRRVDDPVVEMLVDMIVQDEQRHDALLAAMVRRLEEEVSFLPAPGALPVPDESMSLDQDTATEIAASVRGLIRNEHEGSRHLRHLARQEPTLYGGLYPLLLETIARDGEKHAIILRYLLHRIGGLASR
jgi:hypothetical protein